MPKTATTTRKRVNVSLSEETLRLLDRVASKGDRSQLIDQAVRAFVSDRSKAAIRERLKQGAKARAQRDLGIAEEWFHLENEAGEGRRRGK
jgi:CopG family transcriptional regulator/antitoxin EndoAI